MHPCRCRNVTRESDAAAEVFSLFTTAVAILSNVNDPIESKSLSDEEDDSNQQAAQKEVRTEAENAGSQSPNKRASRIRPHPAPSNRERINGVIR